ncbi:hypothetical protein FVE85_1922 [Porphyridium purpureum]|uniref:Uncharacterized protein n=1 Tax=Porphyridium purpureum TaxID=35688 RepID=A0A5J4YZ84_PORPP|nr:hypothetical protein FVE85_1922 [Porphyridium purpureum]|eukprot:POR3028..scf209_3
MVPDLDCGIHPCKDAFDRERASRFSDLGWSSLANFCTAARPGSSLVLPALSCSVVNLQAAAARASSPPSLLSESETIVRSPTFSTTSDNLVDLFSSVSALCGPHRRALVFLEQRRLGSNEMCLSLIVFTAPQSVSKINFRLRSDMPIQLSVSVFGMIQSHRIPGTHAWKAADERPFYQQRTIWKNISRCSRHARTFRKSFAICVVDGAKPSVVSSQHGKIQNRPSVPRVLCGKD